MNDSDVIIYTDGSSRGNPGPGGYGIGKETCKSGYVKEYSKGFKLTTNNRMELLAVIDALKKLKQTNLKIIIYTDSKYVVDSIEKKWVFKWEKVNDTNVKGYKIYWRDTTSPIWQYERFVGDVDSHTLEGIVIDNYFFGISTVGKNGFESPVVFPNGVFKN